MMKKVIFGVFALLALSRCDNSSDKLVPNLPNQTVNEKIRDIVDPRIDILFVVDNSGSMSTHQRNLSTNINLFVDEIKNLSFLDYRIGVTTSTHYFDSRNVSPGENGNLIGIPNYVDKKTPNGDVILRDRLMVGTRSYTHEYFLDPVMNGLSPAAQAGVNAGFFRRDAYLAVIFITDAEDQGPTTAQGLFDFLVNLKGGRRDKVLSYGAIIPTNSTRNCDRDDGGVTPRKLEEFIGLTKGIYFDLCDQDYGLKLAGIAKNLASRVAGEILLSRIPKVETIRITFGSQTIPSHPRHGWIYNPRTNSISFGEDLELQPEPPGTEIDIFFEPANPF